RNWETTRQNAEGWASTGAGGHRSHQMYHAAMHQTERRLTVEGSIPYPQRNGDSNGQGFY
ncbi:MAG: hypothetical protein KA164_14165, partial [Rhodoferax sp.]|nr:hypothetical protein [Rhodoferax sp.]